MTPEKPLRHTETNAIVAGRGAEKSIGLYIDGFYNPRRRHSAIGYKSPIAFEAKMASIE